MPRVTRGSTKTHPGENFTASLVFLAPPPDAFWPGLPQLPLPWIYPGVKEDRYGKNPCFRKENEPFMVGLKG